MHLMHGLQVQTRAKETIASTSYVTTLMHRNPHNMLPNSCSSTRKVRRLFDDCNAGPNWEAQFCR